VADNRLNGNTGGQIISALISPAYHLTPQATSS
jgi:hypothetical protein